MKYILCAAALLGSTQIAMSNTSIFHHQAVMTTEAPAGSTFSVETMADSGRIVLMSSTWKPSKKHIRAERLLAGMLFGECRGQGAKCMDAVGHVAMNRAKLGLDDRFGRGLWGVLKKRKAFSCFLKSDPSSKVIAKAMKGKLKPNTKDEERWVMALNIAHELMHTPSKDPTRGSTYYHAKWMTAKWSRDKGMKKMTAFAGHIFYKFTPKKKASV